MELIKRRGRFRISTDHLFSIPNDIYWENAKKAEEDKEKELKEIFSNFFIVRAEHSYMDNAIGYEAFSPLFRPVEPQS